MRKWGRLALLYQSLWGAVFVYINYRIHYCWYQKRKLLNQLYICVFRNLNCLFSFLPGRCKKNSKYRWTLILILISSKLCPSGYDGGLVIWRPWGVGGSNPTVGKIFCNVHLFRVPDSWTCSVQMKSSMTFIRGNRCIEREKDTFKNDREVKRLNECALALSDITFYRKPNKHIN